MAQRKATQGLSEHPMEQAIIKALFDGQSPRQIAAWTKPPVSHITIWRYRETILRPTIANAALLKSILPPGAHRPHGNTKTEREKPVEQQGLSDSGNTGNRKEDGKQEDVSHVSEEVKQNVTDAILAAPALTAMTHVLTIRENRIAAQEDRHRRLRMVMHERAEDMKDVPGGKSGVLARDYKGEREVFKVDTGLLSEMREHEKQIATELGQWQEVAQGNVSIQIVLPAAGGQQPRISYVSDDQIESSSEEEIGLIQP